MMVAVIILTALLSFQFVSAIERDCMGWRLCLALRLFFSLISQKTSFKGLTNSTKYVILTV